MEAITDFSSLTLPDAVKTALTGQGITSPTPIQAQAIPVALKGRDVVGLAQTGTGKTLAFCLPLITALDKKENQDATALILAPTREIAIQVTEVIKKLTAEMKGRWTPLLVIGGVGMQPQIDGLTKKPRLIVATPGRLVDHMREGNAKLNTVSFLVLDEADRMLDMGFAPQLNEILRGLPSERQTMLFSATFPREISDMSSKYLKNPERVEVGAGHSKVVDTVTQVVKEMSEDDKFPQLLAALEEREGTIIVFVRTKHRTERIAKQLEKKGHSAGRIHGDRSQSQRQNTLSQFKEGTIRVLVATDIAARGIDVANVAHVINYDIPNVPEEYIHRIGRTGRAGATGDALTFVTPEVVEEWFEIQKLIAPEEVKGKSRPRNAAKPEKPQQQRHGGHRHQQQQQGGQERQQNQGGQRHAHGGQGQRHPGQQGGGQQRRYDRNDRNDRGPRHDNRGTQGGHRQTNWRDDNRSTSQHAHAHQAHNAGNRNYEHDEDDNFAQPSMEEQLTRIDHQSGNRNRHRGGGNQGHQGSRSQHRGNDRGHNQNRSQHRGHDRGRGPAQGHADPHNRAQPAAASNEFRDDAEDNFGNREQNETSGQKKGFFSWFKK